MAAMTVTTQSVLASASGRKSSNYTPLSAPSSSMQCLFNGMSPRSSPRGLATVTTMAYRGGNCQDGYRRGGAWGPFMMGPDAVMAGAALADLARKFQTGNSAVFGGPNTETTQQVPLFVDLQENEQQYTLTADVPGLQKSDLKITVNQKDRSLKISGERKRSSGSEQKEEDQRKFRRQFERRMGKFQRVFSMIPDTADLSSVAARVDKGVLTIQIKKIAKVESDDTMDINIE